MVFVAVFIIVVGVCLKTSVVLIFGLVDVIVVVFATAFFVVYAIIFIKIIFYFVFVDIIIALLYLFKFQLSMYYLSFLIIVLL